MIFDIFLSIFFYNKQSKFSKKNFGTALLDFSEEFFFPMEETLEKCIK